MRVYKNDPAPFDGLLFFIWSLLFESFEGRTDGGFQEMVLPRHDCESNESCIPITAWLTVLSQVSTISTARNKIKTH